MESKRSSLRIATISARDATVTHLMKRIKDLLGQGKFLKVHDLLLERENNVQNELEKLRTDLVLVELERSKYKQELESVQDSQILKGKNEEIRGLNKELSQHRDQIFESNKLVEVYLENLNCSNLKVTSLERELEDLKGVKSLADKEHTIELTESLEELKRLLVEASIENRKSNETIEEMERGKSKDYQTIKELKSKLLEADAAKRNFDGNVQQIRRQVAVVDCLIKKMREQESEIKRLKNDKVLDVQSMETMRLRKMVDTQVVEGLKRQLAEAVTAKRKSDETILEITHSKISEVECLNAKLQKMANEIKILEGQKLLDCQTMEELRAQKRVDSQIVEELRVQLLESDFEKRKFDEAIGTMKCQMVDMDCLNVELKDEIKKFQEELKRKLWESDFEKREFIEAIGAMKCQMVDMDCLNVKLRDEIKKFEEEKSLRAQTMDGMRRQKEEDYRTVEDLKKQLLGADIEKKKSSEITEDMRRDRILKVSILNAKLQGTEIENKALKGNKLLDAQTVKKLRRLLSVADIEKRKTDETIQEIKVHNLKLNQNIKDMQGRLSEQEELIRRFETNQMMRHDKLKAYQTSEGHTEKLHQDGGDTFQDSKDDNGRLISPRLHSGTMIQGSDIIEISDNDDEKDHGRSVEALGLKSTNYSSENEKCKKVVSFSQLISPCTSSLKRKCNSPGKEDEIVEQQNKRYKQE